MWFKQTDILSTVCVSLIVDFLEWQYQVIWMSVLNFCSVIYEPQKQWWIYPYLSVYRIMDTAKYSVHIRFTFPGRVTAIELHTKTRNSWNYNGLNSFNNPTYILLEHRSIKKRDQGTREVSHSSLSCMTSFLVGCYKLSINWQLPTVGFKPLLHVLSGPSETVYW